MASVMVWYGAMCLHTVWQRSAHNCEKYDIGPEMYIVMGDLYATIVSHLCVLIWLQQSVTGEMTRAAVGSCHDFHEKVTSTWYVLVRSVFSM